MTDTQDRLERLAECERRIALAFDRIGAGVEDVLTRPVPQAVPDAQVIALQAELDAERQANRQLSERVRSLGEKQQTTMAALERRLTQLTKSHETMQDELSRYKQINVVLVEANKILIEGSDGAVEQALLAEVQTLRATRDLEAEEINAVIQSIETLINEPKPEDTPHA